MTDLDAIRRGIQPAAQQASHHHHTIDLEAIQSRINLPLTSGFRQLSLARDTLAYDDAPALVALVRELHALADIGHKLDDRRSPLYAMRTLILGRVQAGGGR